MKDIVEPHYKWKQKLDLQKELEYIWIGRGVIETKNPLSEEGVSHLLRYEDSNLGHAD